MDNPNSCFHCGESIPSGIDLTIEFENQTKSLCCVGCQQVAKTIIDSGMSHYYKYRTEYAETPDVEFSAISSKLQQQLESYDLPAVQQNFVQTKADGNKVAKISIQGISCAACVWLIEKYINRQPGVEQCSVNMTQHSAQVEWNPEATKLSDILTVIYQIGYQGFPFDPNQVEEQIKNESRQALRRVLIAGLGSMQAMMFAVPLYVGAWTYIADEHQFAFRLASMIMTLPVVLYSALPFFKAAIRAIKTKHLSMDVPVSIAIGGAFVASVWITFNGGEEVYFDSVCMFTFFLSIGRYLEMRARHRAGLENSRLNHAFPDTATVFTGNGDETAVVAASQVVAGQKLLIKAGEPVAVDCLIESGTSYFDESIVTGEFAPVKRTTGDKLLGGSTNTDQPIIASALNTTSESRVSRIQSLLDQAQNNKPKVAMMADQIAQYFVAAVLLSAGSIGFYWASQGSDHWFAIMLSILVVTCPCALSLATPTALTVASQKLMSLGVLITKGSALESLKNADWILFDKTGTLTEGQYQIKEVKVLDSSFNEGQLSALAALLESRSEHPIAKAFLKIPQIKEWPLELVSINQVQGLGIEAEVKFGNQQTVNKIKIGKPQFALGQNQSEQNGQVYLTINNQPSAEFVLEDKPRQGAEELLHTLGKQFKIGLLTGDGSQQAADFAKALPFDKVELGLTPEQKLEHLKQLQDQGLSVAMIGDGVNDLPVIGQAQISIAMGAGSELTKQHADTVLLNSRLKSVQALVDMSKKTSGVIKQNLTWSLMYNATALPLAAMGLIPPWMAAIGMSFSSLIVVFNALRLNRLQQSY